MASDTAAGSFVLPQPPPPAPMHTVWAKSQLAVDGDWWMPLWQHLDDTAAVADALWEERLAPARRQGLARSCGGEEHARRLAVWLAAVHDVGKASAAFAMKVETLAHRMQEAGFGLPAMTALAQRQAPHGLVGQIAVRRWLLERQPGGEWANRLSTIVGGHHGVYPTAAQLAPDGVQPEALRLEGPEWRAARAALLDRAAALAGVDDAWWSARTEGQLHDVDLVTLTGFLIQCDWIASNTQLFPLTRLDAEIGEPIESCVTRARRAINRLALPPRWEAPVPESPAELIHARFALPPGAEPRPSQLALIEAAMRCDKPSLLLFEAPTGEGKTEAALAAAEVLAQRFGLSGVMVALPTKATTDAMFSRVLDWLERVVPAGTSAATVLSHGSAEFNDDYRSIMRDDAQFSPIYAEEKTAGASHPGGAAADAHWWLRGRKTAALASFVVGTIDQLLFAALKARHLVLRHLGITAQVVIIDEVHAADEYMLVYLTRVLEWLGAAGVPVIGLSATLPPARREALLGAYELGCRRAAGDALWDDEPVSDEVAAAAEARGYPLVVSADGRSAAAVECSPSGRRSVMAVEAIGDDLETLVARLRVDVRDGGCVAIVRNTVGRAQAVFERLRAEFSEDEVVLLHSRFLGVDRRRLERDIVEKLGPDGERPKRLIVCATQVIEQSLDLDFDLMVTDLAPIDLVIQRAGRVHRHAREPHARPSALRAPRLLITGADGLLSGALPTMDPGSAYIYGEASLLRTAATLSAHLAATGGTLTSPDDVASLVRRAYDLASPPPSEWESAWRAADAKAADARVNQHDRASLAVIPPPETGRLEEWSRASAGEAREEGLGRAQVRDADDALSVVAVMRVDGRLRSLSWLETFGERLLDDEWIDDGLARAVAQCTVTLPSQVLRGGDDAVNAVIDQLEREGTASWQASRWLRGTLPLVFDESMSVVLGTVRLTYDRTLGLTHTTLAKGER